MAVAARRERERTARREAILDAAQELVAAQGYHGMRMDSVAEAVELSKGTLYLYFENKDALCAAVATRLLDTLIPFMESALENTSTGLDAVHKLFQKYSDFTQENPHHFRFALAWLSEGERMDDSTEAFQIYRGRVGDMLSLVVASLKRGQADGSIRADVDPLPQALQLWTSFLGVVMVGLNREAMAQRVPVPMDFEQLVPLHLDAMVRALSSEGAS
ncbi:MAG: TetR/AcrR family transcriptional regulator [Deltaproteobacteria bacterium]|nr:TetR/AcrR family transcriptional regulator [Deltaproteobacteria bacterium]MBW2629987.1 TetR/AcrR family transcriptional regulator [Deltaproteobacteria bacterium]MBW2688207.1 TetR/AcrR family transcriptional regulator [Deltaproteobacteria bacterium]